MNSHWYPIKSEYKLGELFEDIYYKIKKIEDTLKEMSTPKAK